MGFYQNHILPKLCDLAMRNSRLAPYRSRAVGMASGRVLEVGAGSGLNFAHYATGVDEIVALEPSPRLVRMARRAAEAARAPVAFVEASGEAIPIDSSSIDSVVLTWTLCSIPDAGKALCEMRRVLKPGGRLVFVEHGLAPERGVQRWQHRLTPLWKRVSGGCHLDRPMKELIETAGFHIETLQTGYAPGPKFATYFYEGCARPER